MEMNAIRARPITGHHISITAILSYITYPLTCLLLDCNYLFIYLPTLLSHPYIHTSTIHPPD